ncbi:hypothetical protein RJ55_04693 [Drechmeria coniospora]|nr:hypothetical protein RJ55_04693 [Drechmeria coniospora]
MSTTKTAVVGKLAFVKEHPEYKLNSPQGRLQALNDIAILKLSTPIAESDKIKYATLPKNGSDPVINSTAIVAGWGGQVPRLGSPAAEKLRKVAIPVLARKDCWTFVPAFAGRDTIVCAGGGDKGIFAFDSGGPLIDQKTGHLIGVVSAGDGHHPGIYTRVGSYIPFIKEYLGSVSNPDPNAPSRTEAYEEAVEASKVWNKQVDEYCQKFDKVNIYDCRDEAAKCQGLRKPDGKMDEVYQCIDKKVDKLVEWIKEWEMKRKGSSQA